MITLRPYQKNYTDDTRTALSQYRRVLLQASTGAGKTIMFSYIASESQKYNRKVLIVSPRTEILLQNGGTLERFGLSVQYISPKHRNVPTANIVSAMAQTLRRRVDKPEWIEYLRSVELLIIDECHTCDADFIHDYVSEKCFVLGVSATPRRMGKMKQLGTMYKAMVTGVTISDLIEQKYLAKARHYSIAAPKLDIPIENGDYNQKALAKRFESKPLYVGVVSEYMRLTPHKKAVCFCVSSAQAIGVTEEFNRCGISAKYVLSGKFEEDKTMSGDRKAVMDSFARSEFEVLVNVGVLVAGWDCPDVQVVIANFSTISMTKWKQSLGRGARVCEGKTEFTILDCGGNYKKLGTYDFEPEWCLWHDEGNTGGMQPTKECEPNKKDINGKLGCGRLIPQSCKICPACGYEFRTEKHEYVMHLEEVVANKNKEEETIEEWVSQRVLWGWNNNRILVSVCLANIPEEKKAFMEAIRYLKSAKGGKITGYYWQHFKERIWDDVKRKHEEKLRAKEYNLEM